MEAEITGFISRVFSGCTYTAAFYENEGAWRFQLSFSSSTGNFTINPPRGCCLMSVQSMGQTVSFTLVLFVSDFIKNYSKSILN